MKYQNPIILSDYSDPDVIRYNDNYYLVASSFNHTPILPILKSKDLVNFKILRYVDDKIPFKRFDHVCHGDGVWAPSIRYHDGYFYIIVPYPDEGIYIYKTDDIENGAFESWCLIEGKGIIDPCPIWDNGKCYLVCGFAKSRIGFNSMLGLYEVSSDLKKNISGEYKIIFDGHNIAPTIEGPKFYKRNDYFYILAPAGSVKTGWQVALRSKNIYGPYEQKIVMLQNDSKINGPHQGALVSLDDGKDVFYHFQDLKCYGRIVHLEPVKWINDWPIIGNVKDELLGGTPVDEWDYFVNPNFDYKIDSSDDFKDDKLSLMWQTPANKKDDLYKLDNGLILYANSNLESINKLDLLPNAFLTKLIYKSFEVKTSCNLHLNDGEDVGLCYMGMDYASINVINKNNKYYVRIIKGNFSDIENEIIYEEEYNDDKIIFNLLYLEPNKYILGINNKYYKYEFIATPGRWIGGKYGIYCRGNNGGYSKFNYFYVVEVQNENR